MDHRRQRDLLVGVRHAELDQRPRTLAEDRPGLGEEEQHAALDQPAVPAQLGRAVELITEEPALRPGWNLSRHVGG